MSYRVTCKGATGAHLETAKAAADKVFADAGIEPWEGFDGMGRIEFFDDSGYAKEHRPTAAQRHAASIYVSARVAANAVIPGREIAFLEWVSDDPEGDARELAEMRAYIAKVRATHEGRR